jgi:hypothetical protein
MKYPMVGFSIIIIEISFEITVVYLFKVSVSSDVTKCRWIIPSSPGSINLIRLDKLVSDRQYKVATYDSINHTWLVYKKVPKFFSSSPGGTLTLQIEMETENSLLDLRFVTLREELTSDGDYPCNEQFKCKSTGARGVFCISPELVKRKQ